MKSQDMIMCDECGLPAEICNICVFASMASHCETEKERRELADEYRNMIKALKKHWQDEAREDLARHITTDKGTAYYQCIPLEHYINQLKGDK